MPITDREKETFAQLVRAMANQAVALVSCTDKNTGEAVTCLCAALSRTEKPQTAADLKFLPLAKLFSGDPGDEIFIPNEAREEALEYGPQMVRRRPQAQVEPGSTGGLSLVQGDKKEQGGN